MITEDGAVTNPSTEEFLRNCMAEFEGFIQGVYTVLPRNEQAAHSMLPGRPFRR